MQIQVTATWDDLRNLDQVISEIEGQKILRANKVTLDDRHLKPKQHLTLKHQHETYYGGKLEFI